MEIRLSVKKIGEMYGIMVDDAWIRMDDGDNLILTLVGTTPAERR